MMTERLKLFKAFCDAELLDKLDAWRRKKREVQRTRSLDTVAMLWLFVSIAAYSGAGSLKEIIRLGLLDCGWDLNVSEAAFCKARKRFSPAGVISSLGGTGEAC